jgi:hypothetical protein
VKAARATDPAGLKRVLVIWPGAAALVCAVAAATVVAPVAAPEAMAATAMAEPAIEAMSVDSLRLGMLLPDKMKPSVGRVVCAVFHPWARARRQGWGKAWACGCAADQGGGHFLDHHARWVLETPPCLKFRQIDTQNLHKGLWPKSYRSCPFALFRASTCMFAGRNEPGLPMLGMSQYDRNA